MDFKAMIRPVRFGKPPEGPVPLPHLRTLSPSRRLAALAEARDVLAVLPGPGEALHAIQTGRYDVADVIDAILERRGTVSHLRIATLSYNRRNLERMSAWVESSAVGQLTLLCSRFFVAHNRELFEATRQALTQRHRVAASRNHCKIICFEFCTGDKLTLTGSANLRGNGNTEQFCLIHDEELHDWCGTWIDAQVTGNEHKDQ